ncbi:MAG: restriction endonuclease subunit S [Oscillospiraceae bacterium]|nr:restriction endonuclease subunit S [Oscillospiraceae bacterium]
MKKSIIEKYLQGGQGNLSAKIIKSLKFNLPTLPEQTKIANLLSTLDKNINLNKQKLYKLEMFKKGILQKMFV